MFLHRLQSPHLFHSPNHTVESRVTAVTTNKKAGIASSCQWLGRGHSSSPARTPPATTGQLVHGNRRRTSDSTETSSGEGSFLLPATEPCPPPTSCHRRDTGRLCAPAVPPLLTGLGLHVCHKIWGVLFLPDLGGSGQSLTHDWNRSSLFPQDKPPLPLLKYL